MERKSVMLLLVLSLLLLPSICFGAEAQQFTISSTELTELQQIMSEQEKLLNQKLNKMLEISETNSEQLATELEDTQSQLMTLQARLKTAENSLSEASNLIAEQNKSLKTLGSDKEPAAASKDKSN